MDELNSLLLSEDKGIEGKYLTFAVDTEDYGIEIVYVTEIITMMAITDVPELPPYIKGIINLRGRIIPVMDVRLRFNRSPAEYDDRTCTIVVDINGTSIGLIVDTVREVMDIADETISEPADSKVGYHNRYIKGIGKTAFGVKLLLDLENLVSDKSY